MDLFEEIYASMLGVSLEPIEGIEDAFAPGEACEQISQEIWQSYLRVLEKLGTPEDADLERIMDYQADITVILCQRMFRYGQLYGRIDT